MLLNLSDVLTSMNSLESSIGSLKGYLCLELCGLFLKRSVAESAEMMTLKTLKVLDHEILVKTSLLAHNFNNIKKVLIF